MSQTGWWYYFPVVLAVKTPLAFLMVAILGVILCVRRRAAAWALPVAFSLGILFPAMMGNINIGLRHILPIYAGLSIAGGVALVQLAEWSSAKKWAGPAALIVVLWLAASGIWKHPYYLAYFNELAGSHPEKILVDSDLDWSQDYVEVAERLRAMNVTRGELRLRALAEPVLRSVAGLSEDQAVAAVDSVVGLGGGEPVRRYAESVWTAAQISEPGAVLGQVDTGGQGG